MYTIFENTSQRNNRQYDDVVMLAEIFQYENISHYREIFEKFQGMQFELFQKISTLLLKWCFAVLLLIVCFKTRLITCSFFAKFS
jgi:hypothetical protein